MKLFRITILVAFAVTVTGCSLNEQPEHFVSRDNFYKTEIECRAAINSCYRPMKSIFVGKFVGLTEGCCDLFTPTTNSKNDFTLAVSPAEPQFGAKIWTLAYQGVMYCNECIACIDKSPINTTAKGRMTSEARIIRALYYYVLTNVFNGVPFYTDMVATQEDLAAIRKLPRTDANEIRRLLYEDLNNNVLPYYEANPSEKVRGSEVKEQRMGYPLALMLMAKFAMWYKDWDSALTPLLAIENLYGEFSEERYPLYETMWRYKNTAESIFEIQHAWSETGVQFQGNAAQYMYPTVDSQGEGWYNGVYLPEIGTTVTKNSPLACTAHYAIYYSKRSTTPEEDASKANAIMNPLPLKFTTYDEATGRFTTEIDVEAFKTGTIRGQKIDRRALIALGYGNTENGETFNDVKKRGKPFCGPKFWCPGLVSDHDSNNYKIFRYADALLMMAECYTMKENQSLALKYLNLTRKRAGVAEKSGFFTQDDLMAEIRDERARELGGEMHRKFDLVRWGIWYNQTVTYNYSNDILNGNIRPCHEYYPIPDAECALSGYILTNDDYQL